MSALLVGGASTIVSCKDYDGDTIGEYTSDLARKIAEQEEWLLKLDKDKNGFVRDWVDSYIKGLEQSNLSDTEKLTAIQNFAAKLKALTEMQDALEQVVKLTENSGTGEGGSSLDAILNVSPEVLTGVLNGTNIGGVNLTTEAVKQLLDNADKYNEVLTEIINNGGYGVDFSQFVTQTYLTTMLDGYLKSDALDGYIKSDALTEYLKKSDLDLSKYLTSEDLVGYALKADIITLDDVKNNLLGDYYTKTEVDNLIKGCVTPEQLAEKIAGLISGTEVEDKIKDAIAGLVTTQALEAKVTELMTEINKKLNISEFETFKETYNSDITTLTERLDKIDGVINGINTSIDGINSDITKLNGEVAGLGTKLEALEGLATLFEGQFNLLQQNIDKVNGRIDALVTSVNIDKVSNPIFGSLNLPFGVKSSVLCGIYGGSLNGFTFPNTDERAHYVNPSERNWTIANGAPSVTFDGVAQTTTGGSVLVTVNPNNVDAQGVHLQLVSRDGTVAPAYGDLILQKDYTKITTRGVANGAYRADAVINPGEAYKAKPNINASELKEAAKNVFKSIKERKNIGLVDAAKTVFSNFKNALPEYYALNYSWTDGDKVNSVKTDYEIAALTIEPLSFQTLYGRGKTIQKRIPQIEDYLGINLADYQFNWKDLGHVDDMTPSITLEIPDAEDITIDGSKIDPKFELDEDKLIVVPTLEKTYDEYGNVTDIVMGKVEVKVKEGFVKIKDMDLGKANVTIGKKDTTITVTVKMDNFNAMIDNINSQVGGMMGTVNNLVDKIQGGFDRINNGVIARLNKVIEKVNKITENPNNLLQPVMLYSDANDGVGRLSESPIAPSLFKLNGQSSGSVNLVPTSYTAELFAPAYKKYIQVNALDGGKASVSSNMLDFNQRAVTLTAEKGKYEIIYSAIDFYGWIATKKYYVEVK